MPLPSSAAEVTNFALSHLMGMLGLAAPPGEGAGIALPNGGRLTFNVGGRGSGGAMPALENGGGHTPTGPTVRDPHRARP